MILLLAQPSLLLFIHRGDQSFDKRESACTPVPGTHWKGTVECFAGKQSRLRCTLLMHWEAGYEHPWAVLTDLSPEQAEVSWYGMRTWIESGFKDFKRGLWGWHHSKMQDASRVERLWLAMAVAQVWTVSVGCLAEDKEHKSAAGESLPAQHIACRRRKRPEGQPPPQSESGWAPLSRSH